VSFDHGAKENGHPFDKFTKAKFRGALYTVSSTAVTATFVAAALQAPHAD